MKMHYALSLVGVVCLLCSTCGKAPESEVELQPFIQASNPVAAGRYLVIIGQCNDCHTEGYLTTEGNVPEEDWLTGSKVGWRGPWGTTYPPNLRIRVQELTEEQWVELLRTRKVRPPMPWTSVNRMSVVDSRAIYAYLKSIGPKGERMPLALGPEEEPATPYLSLVPLNVPVESIQAGTR